MSPYEKLGTLRLIDLQVLRFIIFQKFGTKDHNFAKDFDEIATSLMQHPPQIQEYQPIKQNVRLSTNGR